MVSYVRSERHADPQVDCLPNYPSFTGGPLAAHAYDISVATDNINPEYIDNIRRYATKYQ